MGCICAFSRGFGFSFVPHYFFSSSVSDSVGRGGSCVRVRAPHRQSTDQDACHYTIKIITFENVLNATDLTFNTFNYSMSSSLEMSEIGVSCSMKKSAMTLNILF